MKRQKGLGYALMTAGLWGFLAIGLKVMSNQIDSVTIVWCRFAVAFVCLFVFHSFTKPSNLKILIRPPFALILAALGLMWNYIGFTLGIEYTGPANTQVIIQTGPIILALFSILFFKEKINRQQILGLVLAVVGMVFFYYKSLETMFGTTALYNRGFFLTLSAAFTWALYGILQKKLVTNHTTSSLNLFIFGLPSIVLLPFVNFSSLENLSWEHWILLTILGLITLVAYGSLSQSLKYLEASKVSVILIMNPVITFIAMAILGAMGVTWIASEKFTLATTTGAIIVLIGAILVVRKSKKKN